MPGIEIKGLDKLFVKLDRAAAIDTLVPPMERGTKRLQRRMQEYPPSPAKSKYVRTGTYGRRWTTPPLERSASGLVGRAGNNVGYAPFVGSEQFQARVHRGRWNTDAKIVKDEEPAILADFQQAIDKALGS